MFQPGILESEVVGFWGGCREADDNGDVIGCDPDPGGERGIREELAEIAVDQGAIKPGPSGRGAFVGPSIEPVQERQLYQGQVVYGGVEEVGDVAVKAGSVLVASCSREIKVANDHPGRANGGPERQEFGQESSRVTVVSRAVDVGDRERVLTLILQTDAV